MNKAVFLDRDGVLNRERGDYTWRQEDVVLVDGIEKTLRYLKDQGFKLLVVTNQAGIAKGLYGPADVQNVYRTLDTLLGGNVLDDMQYCPHHPNFGKCLCRKPASLMIEKLAAMHSVDLSRSLLIGDTDRDIEAAHAVGLKAWKVASNENTWPAVKEKIANL